MKEKLLSTISALAFASSLLPAMPVHAQADRAVTVSACGTPNNTPVVGIDYPITQDTSAKICTSAVLSGNVTATNPSVGPTGAAVPGNATAVGFSNGSGCLTIPSSTNPLPTTFSSGNLTSAGNVTAVASAFADGWSVTAGTKADSAYTSGSGSEISILKGIFTNTGAAIPAGTNTIGYVGGDGSAGTPSAHVVSVQGEASMTPVLTGASASGAIVSQIECDSHVFKHITSATDTLAVQGVTAKTVKICGVQASFSGSAAQSIFIENTASTNANCSSTLTQITGLYTGNSSSPISTGFYAAIWGGLANTSANGVCINSSGTGGVDVDIWYTQGS